MATTVKLYHQRTLITLTLGALGTVGLWQSSLAQSSGDDQAGDPALSLGQQLFEERNFTNPAADYGASCAECHKHGAAIAERATRRYADYTPRSLTATKGVTLRNTPSLLGVPDEGPYGLDGGADDLEQLIEAKLLGEMMGWSDDDRDRALAAIHFTLSEEGNGGGTGKTYAEQFEDVYDIEIAALGAEEAVAQAARAIAGYVRSLESTRTAPWDAFVEQNRLHEGPNPGEDPKSFAYGVASRIGNQEGRLLIKRPVGFSSEAYAGFKIFFRTFDEGEGDGGVGNCVSCHVPPNFTDRGHHNVGVAEAEYDSVFGAGAAAKLQLPETPSAATAAQPDEDRPGALDLGRFNVDPAAENAGAFLTPSLRNLAGSDPYFHNGSAATLREAVAAKVAASQAASRGELPWADEELSAMMLTEEDIDPLVAFIQQLEDVPPEDFRELLINFADD